MKLIDRYIIKELLIYLFAALLILTLIFVVGEFLRGESDASPGQLIYYVALNIPQVIAQMMAPAVMIATMTTLTMLNRKNELAAMQAGGIGINHISMLVLIIAFCISCLNLFMNDRITPPLAHKRQLYYWRDIKGRKDFSLDIKSSKVWYRNRNHIFNLQTFNPSTNQIQGFGLYVFDDAFQLQEHVSAAHASFDGGTWKLSNGMITIFPKRDLFPLSKHFDTKELKLDVTPHDFREIDKHVESLRLKELWHFITRNRQSGINTKSYEVDFHARICLAFIPILMALIVIPYSIRPHRQGGLGKDLSLCMLIMIFYWIVYSVMLSIGRSGTLEPWIAVWSPSIFGLIYVVYSSLRKAY